MSSDSLQQACDTVRSLISDPDSRLALVVETGADEAGAVGTSDAYLRLALAALEFVRDAQLGQAAFATIGDERLPSTTSFGEVFTGFEVDIENGLMTASESQTQAIVIYFQWLSPPGEKA